MSIDQKTIKKDGVWTVDGRPRETLQILSHTRPKSLPGKSIITLLVTFPPNGATPSHTHGGAAVTGLVQKGRLLNQMNDDEAEEYSIGGNMTWLEGPGCRHRRGENLSETEEGAFYAVFAIDDKYVEERGYEGLLVLDAEEEEKKKDGK